MRFLLRRCTSCNRYTLKARCPACDADTESVHPAKYSPDDKYARYRLASRYAERAADNDGGGGSGGDGPQKAQ